MSGLNKFAAGMVLAASLMSPATVWAQSSSSLQEAIDTCAVVIEEQYAGNFANQGACVGIVGALLTGTSDPNQVVADLVAALAELYQNDPRCVIADTELPEAIALAASFSTDPEQRLLVIDISETIRLCERATTAAIGAFAASPA